MIIEKSVKIIVIKFFFILRLFNKIKRFERWETVDIFPYHVFKKLNIKWIELYPVRLKRERGLEVLIKIHVRSSRTNSTIVDYMYFKDDLITRQVYTHSDSDRWPWSSTSPCWPCCGSRGSWEESEGGETFLTRGRVFFHTINSNYVQKLFKKEKIETIFCFVFFITNWNIFKFYWHFFTFLMIRTVTDSTPAILISISLFLFPSILPHNFKGIVIWLHIFYLIVLDIINWFFFQYLINVKRMYFVE